jgi:hypothetical protein
MTWLLSPNILLAGAIAVGGIGLTTYHFTKVSGARTEGIAIGKGGASTAALEAAKKTAEAEREAEADVGTLDDRSDIIALCKRSASCKERRTLK